MSRLGLKTVAKVAVQQSSASAQPAPAGNDALHAELKRRIQAKADRHAEPASSIREALSRWLNEEL